VARRETVDKRRPEKFQCPGEGKQWRKTDGGKRNAAVAQKRRQRFAEQAGRRPLREIQHRQKPKERRIGRTLLFIKMFLEHQFFILHGAGGAESKIYMTVKRI